jgi:hypothetical protein
MHAGAPMTRASPNCSFQFHENEHKTYLEPNMLIRAELSGALGRNIANEGLFGSQIFGTQ